MSELIIREPSHDEGRRIGHLFRDTPLRAGAQVLGAIRSRPVERFVAAVAGWTEESIVRFRLACQPGVKRTEVAGPLIERVAESARAARMTAIHYAEALEECNEWCAILRELGFARLHSERFFEVSCEQAWKRSMQIFQRHQKRIPANWKTESIRHHGPELAMELIGEHRLMPPEELRAWWRPDSATTFELDLSSFLFDGARPVGALLTRRMEDALCADVLVVRLDNPQLRALANACLLHHAASRLGENGGAIRWVRFRAGEVEHRETANKAFRMKGRELPPRHLFGKTL